MGDLSAHFSTSEFQCHCGCGRCEVQPRLLQALEAVRVEVGEPLHIVSGYRCPGHNKACGGAKDSQHMLGMAADVQAPDLWKLYKAAMRVPMVKGVGIYLRPGGWIHLDVRPETARWAEDGLKRPMGFKAALRILGERVTA